jgi:hypothetical protein
MRRILVVAICLLFVLAGVGAFVATKIVAAVLGALSQLALSVVPLLILAGVGFVLFALLALGSDWYTFFKLIRRFLELLGLL